MRVIFLILIATVVAPISAFSAPTVYLPTGAFYDISSVGLISGGVEIRVGGKPACVVSTSFLQSTNTSGLELLKSLTDKSFDYTVECESFTMPQGTFAVKIRPRLSP